MNVILIIFVSFTTYKGPQKCLIFHQFFIAYWNGDPWSYKHGMLTLCETRVVQKVFESVELWENGAVRIKVIFGEDENASQKGVRIKTWH